MSLLSFVFEGALAALMVVLIAYCAKLNRGLSAIRASDTQINELIGRLVEASDRAEASVAQLKAVGVAQERALRAAIEDAEAAQARLGAVPAGERKSASQPAADAPQALDALVGLEAPSDRSATVPRRGAPESGARPSRTDRSETEQALLAAIRQARAAG